MNREINVFSYFGKVQCDKCCSIQSGWTTYKQTAHSAILLFRSLKSIMNHFHDETYAPTEIENNSLFKASFVSIDILLI